MASLLPADQIASDETGRLVAYVEATFANGVTVTGSGLLVGRNDLLTSTHVLYNPSRGGLATSVHVYLGAELDPDTGRLLGSVADVLVRRPDVLHYGTSVFVTGANDTVTDAEAQHDMALLALTRDIGFDLGWIEIADADPPSAFLAQSYGYPSDFNGLTVGSVSARDSSSRGVIYSTSRDAYQMGAGSSGGPLIYTDANDQLVVVGTKSAVGETEGVWSNLSLHRQALITELSDNNTALGAGARDVLGGETDESLVVSSGAVYWDAGAGDDVLQMAGGAHYFAGGYGLDVLEWAVDRDQVDWQQTTAGQTRLVFQGSPSASVVLDGVERVVLQDARWAADIEDGQAGLAAKLVGAVLGADFVSNQTIMGIALDYLDGGGSVESLIDLGLTTPMAIAVIGRPVANDRDAIAVVFQNITGVAADAGVIDSFASQIGSVPGQLSLEELILVGANHELNLTNIDFVGLVDQGLWYA